ncbi:MAG: rRNA adenine N-6-methyltransferase family protein [Rhizomicrobium sp.]
MRLSEALPSRARPSPTGGWREKLHFLRGLLASPAGVSAILPSSRALSEALAAQIDPARDGPVLELGPGTGAVTQAIVARGIPVSRIVAVEYDRTFADLLAARFPGLYVLNGDALNLTAVLGSPRESYAAIVSGLPLINFPMAVRKAVIADALARMPRGAPFIQISYRGTPAMPATDAMSVERAAFVWRNVPPGYVWVYRRR